MIYLQFRKGAKEDKPSFKDKEMSTNKVSWNLKGVYYNEPKDVTTKEWKTVTIPANINVVFDNDKSINFSIELWKLFRSTAHSLLNANIWEKIEMYTFINKDWYKSISITNPDVKEKITYKWKEIEVGRNYFFMSKFEHPEVEIIKNKKWEFVSADDWDANKFFVEKIKEKFGKKEEQETITETDLEDIF